MIDLVAQLDNGNHSCVVANGTDVRCFDQRGVADLHQILSDEPNFLRNSKIADKVVGKGAAAIMIRGGVAQLYTHIISEGALQLFDNTDVTVEYGLCVSHIINRNGSDWCPVEKLCRDIHNVDDIIPLIDKFLIEIKKPEFNL
ncbi:MAG: DUF1893 domain-containing protein [Rikenellaceae bacterium]